MTFFNKLCVVALAVLFSVSLSACSPKVGSKAWCHNMKEKAKGDWTANDVTEFAKSCLIDMGDK